MKVKRILFFVLVALLGALLLGSILRISAAAGAAQAPIPAQGLRIETADAEEIYVPAVPANAAAAVQAEDLCSLAGVQSGSTMTFTAQYDAWIDQAAPSSNYGSDTSLYVGRSSSGDDRWALVGFDLSALPDDIVVVSATLETYNIVNLARAAGPERADYFIWTDAINASWNETGPDGVTWNEKPPTEPQGDPPSAFQVSDWTRWDVTNIAQGWVSGLLENYGIMLYGDGSTVGTAYFYSSEHADPPRLVITYAPAPCEPLTGVSISGPTLGVTDTSYVFSANIQPTDAGTPITYTWQATDQTGTYDQSSATFTWNTPSAKTITVTAENCDDVIVAATHVVTISTLSPGCDTALTGLSVDGPTQGITGTVYTFTVATSPPSATPPFTYTWRATGQSDMMQTGTFTQTSTSFTWNDLGTKFITVTARNCGGEIVAFHPFDVVRPSQLPDLTITHAWYESGSDRVGYLIKNVGGSTVPAGHVTELYQSSSPVAQVVFDQSLPAGALRADYVTYTWGCAGSDATVLLSADSGDAVAEGDESNNRWWDTWGCDLVPPQIIAGPTVLTTTEHTVVIAWQTDEPCSERVDYSKSYYTPVSQSDSTYRTGHQFTVTGLDNGTTYYYQVFATDQGGNLVNSDEFFFETEPPGTDPREIQSLSLFKFTGNVSTFYEFYILSALLDSTVGLDRVEFYFDGLHLGTDYHYPGGGINFDVIFSPYEMGLAREDFFSQAHTIEARAINLNGASSVLSDSVTPAPEPMDVDVDIQFPPIRYTVYVDQGVAPAGTAVEVDVHAAGYEWGCTDSAWSEGLWPGLNAVDCQNVNAYAVQTIELKVDGTTVATHDPAPGDLDHTFQLSLEGKSLGEYAVEVIARTSDQGQDSEEHTITLALGEPSVSLRREIDRINNHVQVRLIVENDAGAAGPAVVDKVVDWAGDFQPVHKTASNYAVTSEYQLAQYEHLPGNHYHKVEIDLFTGTDDAITLAPGESFTIEYLVVPVLYPWYINTAGPVFGNQPAEVHYEYEGESVIEECWASADASLEAGQALGEANYLIVSDPRRLLWFYLDDDVNTLFSTMAQLAVLKQGALGYLPAYTASRDTLNGLVEPGSLWAEALHPDFSQTKKGYLLIVGELDIVPSHGAGGFWLPFWDHDFVPITDHPYAQTQGGGAPDLIVGRIIGDSPAQLTNGIQTSIGVHEGWDGYGFDHSHALLVSGTGDGTSWFEDDIDDIEDVLESEWHQVRTMKWDNMPSEYRTSSFKGAAQYKDLIVFRGHGLSDEWDPALGTGDFPFDLMGTNPYVVAFSCLTGDFDPSDGDDYGIAEAFFDIGAAAYVGASQRSSRPFNSAASDDFFEQWDVGWETTGEGFIELERDLWGSIDGWTDFWEFWVYEYNFFGDPKFGLDTTLRASDAALPAVVQAPASSLQIHVPDFEVDAVGKQHTVEIPGGQLLVVAGGYPVPYWVVSLDYPKGVRVQDVVLNARSGLTATTGLKLPRTILALDCAACADEGGLAAAAAAAAYWFPALDEVYDWEVIENSDGGTTLRLSTYPFYYNHMTTDVMFYQDFTFDIETFTSTVEIEWLETDAGVYPQGDPVSITLAVSGTVSAQDVIVSGAVNEAISGAPVAGLPLRTLHDLIGRGYLTLVWDSSGVAPGDYSVEVTLMDAEGHVLDREMEDFSLGVTSGEVTTLTATPALFEVGDTISVSMVFSNTGTVPITGTAIVRVQDVDDLVTTAEFTHTVKNLAPSSALTFNDAWDTSGAAGGNYRVLGYVMFAGMTTEPQAVAVNAKQRIYLPLVVRNP